MITRIGLSVLALTLLTAAVPAAHAVDGQVLITQARALAGGVTPGDAAGFPVTISQPGSYRLSGNLTVPNGTTTGILITASHVTLDLNGFAILGSADGSAGGCLFSAVGSGVATPDNVDLFNITVRNGTIQGMGCHGVALNGGSHLVEHMHLRDVASGVNNSSFTVGEKPSIVQDCTVHRAQLTGIALNSGSIRHNVVADAGIGISVGRGSISHNVVTTSDIGIFMGFFGSYSSNVLSGNTSHVSGGVNMGQNLCDTAACPGAQF